MTLTSGNKKIEVEGTITNLFLNTHRIKFEGKIIETHNCSSWDLLGDYDLEVESFESEVSIYKNKGDYIVGQMTKELTTKIVELDELHLTLINLLEIGSEIVQNNNSSYRGLSSLNLEGWNIEVIKINDYKTVFEELKEYGGFACTHNVKINRMDYKCFNYDEVSPILEKFYSYLSFLCGRRIYPSSYKGIKNGDTDFKRYEPRLIDPWSPSMTWYPQLDREIYEHLFIEFYTIWKDTIWKQSKNVILGTYIECFSQVTLENRITSIQVALEMIARIYLVEYKEDLSNRKFKDKNIKERIRITCSNMMIPLETPEQYLRKNTEKFSEPIDFFVDVRNSIVHSKRKIDLSHDNLKHAYNIGLWFLELWLLRIFKYEGKYKNRLSDSVWEGDAANGGCYYTVPWKY